MSDTPKALLGYAHAADDFLFLGGRPNHPAGW
jgi:hypothetical protein